MRNFLAAILLVTLGSVTNIQLKQSGSAPAPPTLKDTGSAPVPALNRDRKYPAEEVRGANHVVIATVPDPKLTRLALHFDRWPRRAG